MSTISTITKPTMHAPPHPGEILRDLYLKPLGVTVTEAAAALETTRKHVSSIVNGRASISAEMALRLGEALRTDPTIWVGLQAQYDLWQARQRRGRPRIRRLRRHAA